MFSIGQAMTLRPGGYAEYKRYHNELWPDLAAIMSDNEVSIAIFLLGNRLVLHAVAPTKAHWDRSNNNATLEKWQAVMTRFLETDQSGKSIVDTLEPAFVFGMFKG